MGGDEELELADELRVAAELELGLEQLDLGRQWSSVSRPTSCRAWPSKHDVRERGPAPERERLSPQLDGALERRGACSRGQPLELEQVELGPDRARSR